MPNCENCKNCKPPKRNPTCHSTCKIYLKWKEDHNALVKEVRNKKYLARIGKY